MSHELGNELFAVVPRTFAREWSQLGWKNHMLIDLWVAQVQQVQPELAPKLTGMLLDLGEKECWACAQTQIAAGCKQSNGSVSVRENR